MAEDSALLCSVTVSLGSRFPTFRKDILLPSSTTPSFENNENQGTVESLDH
jgi:hypothetical protein